MHFLVLGSRRHSCLTNQCDIFYHIKTHNLYVAPVSDFSFLSLDFMTLLSIAQKKHDFDMTYIYICKKDPVKNNHLWNLGHYFPWHNASINYPGPWAVSHSRKKIRDMSNLKILKSEADSQTILPRASVWNAAIGFGWKPSLSPSHKYQSPHADGVEPTAAQSDRQGPVLGYLRVWDWQGDVTEKLRAF